MADHATSSDPAVQRQLDRLTMLSPGRDVLGLDRISRLLDRLGNPHRDMPPVFHVAGTNGKGSTCAFLRAALEASGRRVHVYTSPHLVRFNERIRIADTLIEDALLADLLEEVLSVADDIHPSFFEATTAAAFLAFARTPADACVVEVGLGGRLDATNVIEHPAICGIAQLGLDHQAFLGEKLIDIAAEKAGIAKPGVPLVSQHYPPMIAARVGSVVTAAGANWLPRSGDWDSAIYQDTLHYRDADGRLRLPVPRLAGQHQAGNAALAIAMLRHQQQVSVPETAIRAAMLWADWPARLQQLKSGPLLEQLPEGSEIWIDGGHNPAAGRAIADFFRGHVPAGRPFHIILGMLANKDAAGLLKPFGDRTTTLHAVPISGHEHHAPQELASIARANGITGLVAQDPSAALEWVARHSDRANPPVILIGGSLYLAGEILALNGSFPE